VIALLRFNRYNYLRVNERGRVFRSLSAEEVESSALIFLPWFRHL